MLQNMVKEIKAETNIWMPNRFFLRAQTTDLTSPPTLHQSETCILHHISFSLGHFDAVIHQSFEKILYKATVFNLEHPPWLKQKMGDE